MSRQVIVRSKEQYWKDYILTGLSNKLSKEMIRQQLLDAFEKEIFGLIALRTNTDDWRNLPETPKNKATIVNIMKQAQNKWVSLCIEAARYKETKGIILPSDLEKIQ